MPEQRELLQMFAPNALLPLSLLENAVLRTAVRPEKRLMLAVLREAVMTFQRYVEVKNRRSSRLFREVEEWIDSGDVLWPFAFENICAALGIDAEYLRRGLAVWRDRQLRNRNRARIYRASFLRVNAGGYLARVAGRPQDSF